MHIPGEDYFSCLYNNQKRCQEFENRKVRYTGALGERGEMKNDVITI